MDIEYRPPEHPYRVIGTTPSRPDGPDKVTGRAVYSADVNLPGLVWGEVVRSPHAHALVMGVDTAAAESVPGVLAVVTRADLPRVGSGVIDLAGAPVDIKQATDNILADDRVLYAGHAVAAVAARDRNTAIEAAKLVRVMYEPLPAVTDVDAAMADGAPILLPGMVADHLGEPVSGTNVAWHFRHQFGDPEAGFRDADLVVEREFRFETVHQGYIEPHAATARWDEDGRITLWTSTQGGFGARSQTAGLLGIDPSRVTVMPVEIGGGFGGKTVVFLEPIAALLARKSGQPVKMVMDRKAVFEGSAPAPGGKLAMKIGVREDGCIVAAAADVWFEAGAYPGWVVDTGVKSIFSCYDIPNTRVDGYDVLVNKPKSGAYRAPGAPQVTFATETLVDEICRAQGWDPFEFRRRNAAREGTRRSDGPVFTKIGFVETLEAARSSDHWTTPLRREVGDGRVRGRGVASGFVLHAGRESSVALNLDIDGTVAMTIGSVDIGGSRTSIAMQAAEALGIPGSDVRPTVAHTGAIGFTEISHGSRTTYATGAAAFAAAGRLIDTLRGRAALLWAVDPADVAFDDGTFFAKSDPALELSFLELAGRLDGTGGPVSAVAAVDLPSPGGNVFGTHIVDVEVDKETGRVRVLRYTAVQDAGTAIHPVLVEGQMQGGVAQGIGWALSEGYVMDVDGKMANPGFTDYRMPTAMDLPMIETIIVEVPNPRHPFGVRGAGEVPIVPPVAAVANAIYDAVGVRMSRTPMNPARILEAMSRIPAGSDR